MTFDRRRFFTAAAAGAVALPAAAAASPQNAEAEKRLREDWAWLGRYADDNARIAASDVRVDVVFLGDSITQGWGDKRPGFFTPGRINRGIGGQTTPQMLVRSVADVIALRPRILHLMAGTNDVAGNTGPMTTAQTTGNLAAIAQLARANGIAVLLASVPPADGFPWRPGLETVEGIRAINRWARDAAPWLGARFVDYDPVLATSEGAIRPGLAYDGVHPSEAGYDAMIRALDPVLKAMNA